jgi:hypothetical protein
MEVLENLGEAGNVRSLKGFESNAYMSNSTTFARDILSALAIANHRRMAFYISGLNLPPEPRDL